MRSSYEEQLAHQVRAPLSLLLFSLVHPTGGQLRHLGNGAAVPNFQLNAPVPVRSV
ncbi:unnamed protein product [Ixodes pacificus]